MPRGVQGGRSCGRNVRAGRAILAIKVRYGKRNSCSESETSPGYDFRVVFMTQHEQGSYNKSITGSSERMG